MPAYLATSIDQLPVARGPPRRLSPGARCTRGARPPVKPQLL